MTTPWPALEKGSGVLKSAASAWRDFAVVTTPSPWALVKAEPPEPRAAILATDLKRETLESLRERVRGASMIVGVGSGLSMASLGLVTGSLQWLRTMPALVGVLTYEHIPFAVLILVSSLQAIPQDKINAARLLGAGVPRIFFTLILPLTMPGLVASAILVFSLSASSYLVPILIGAQRIKVLPLFIFSYGTELQNWPLAAALSIVLLVLVVAITYLFARTMNRLSRRGEWEMV
jgi:putative spermidine/putrescine transport system permease protein